MHGPGITGSGSGVGELLSWIRALDTAVTDPLPPICGRLSAEVKSADVVLFKTIVADVLAVMVSRCELGHRMPGIGEKLYDMVLRDRVISWRAAKDVADFSE